MSAAWGIDNNHVTVIWPRTDKIKYQLKEVFNFLNSVELDDEVDVENNPWVSDYFLPVNELIPVGFSDLKWKTIDPQAAYQASNTNGRSVDYQYHKIPRCFIESQKTYWDRIVPVDAVIKRANDVVADTIVHIRTNYDWWTHLTVDLNFYLDTIQKIDGEIYLVSHQPAITQEICAVFPNKIKLLPNKNYDSFTDIAAEMLIISRAKNIYVTEFSTFPEVGWWLGGCQAQVTVLGSEANG
jgi:hypothetical protein